MRVLLLCFLVVSSTAVLENGGERPPVPDKKATARWIAHKSDWGTLTTISTRASTFGFPFGNTYSFSDGTLNDGSGNGVPYFYASKLDASMVDAFEGNNTMVSLSLSEASLGMDSCNISLGGDPESPLCARLVLSGNLFNISGTDEEAIAAMSLQSRHPEMGNWPEDHSWFYAKLGVLEAWLLDIYGGATVLLKPAEYFEM